MALVQLERPGDVLLYSSPPLLIEYRKAIGGLPMTEGICLFEGLER